MFARLLVMCVVAPRFHFRPEMKSTTTLSSCVTRCLGDDPQAGLAVKSWHHPLAATGSSTTLQEAGATN